MTRKHYTEDNTEGYTTAQLEQLNDSLDIALAWEGLYNVLEPVGVMVDGEHLGVDPDAYQQLRERVLAEFDTAQEDPALVEGWRHLSSCPKKKRVERPVGSAGRRGGVRATGREWALTPKRVSDACVAFHPPCPEGIRRRPS